MGSHPLLMVDVNKYGFTPFANGRCQSLLKSTSMGSHPLLNGRCQSLLQSTIMGSNPYNGCQSLLQSTRMGSNSLLMVDVKVYYSQQE